MLMALGLELIQWGSVRPVKNENPMMKRLRDEFKSTYCRFESPTATIIPETQYCIICEVARVHGDACAETTASEYIYIYIYIQWSPSYKATSSADLKLAL